MLQQFVFIILTAVTVICVVSKCIWAKWIYFSPL